MKQIVKMSRLAGMLEKAFRLINEDWFEGKLEMPIITIIPTPRAYAHYTTVNVWDTANGAKREINVASGTLDRNLEDIIASLMHEMVHMFNDTVLNVQDCSRAGQWHNRLFAIEAEKHGLTVEKSPKYGYAITGCDDSLLEWVIAHDELREIEMCRSNIWHNATGIGGKATNGGAPASTSSNSHSRKYICPKCCNSVRATKIVNLICGDCMELMQEA